MASVALQGLPRAYYGVARSFNACSMADITPEKGKYVLLQEGGCQNNSSTEDAACKTKVSSQKSLGHWMGEGPRSGARSAGNLGIWLETVIPSTRTEDSQIPKERNQDSRTQKPRSHDKG